MRLLQIKEIGKVVSGSTPKTDHQEYWEGEIPWVTPKEINRLPNQYLNDTERKITALGLKSCSANMIPKGSILFTSRAPIGLVAIANIDVCTNQGFKSIILNDGFDSLYIYYVLKNYTRELNDLGTGTTFKELSKGTFEKFRIPVPSYVEQIKIGIVLNKTETLIQKRKKSIEQIDEFLESTFFKLFGDVRTNSNKFPEAQLGEKLDLITYGLTVRPNYISEGIPLISARELRSGKLDYDSAPKISISDFDKLSDKAKPKKNDILFSKTGTIGHCALIESDQVFAITQNAARLTFKKDVHPIYALCYLRNSYIQKLANLTAKGNAVRDLQLGDFKKFNFIIPPLELQTEFAKIVETSVKLKAKFENSLIELENFFGSINQKAFNGELNLDKFEIEEEWHNFEGNEPEEKDPVKREEIKQYFENQLKKIEAGDFDEPIGDPFAVDEETAKKQGKPFYKEWKKLQPVKNKSKITWEKVSTQQAANWIKEKYSGYHFTCEMLIRFLMDEYVAFPDYYSSEELKKYPQTNEADDVKSLIFSAVNKQNPYLKLEQVFYNAEEENIQIKVTTDDYELIKERSPKNRSGIYFTITE